MPRPFAREVFRFVQSVLRGDVVWKAVSHDFVDCEKRKTVLVFDCGVIYTTISAPLISVRTLPGFVITIAFGQVLDEKLIAEKYLRASGLDFTIVRPGGLKAKPPTGALKVSKEDTLNSGEISRDLVADVTVAALSDATVSKKVLEIIEDEGVPPKVFNGLTM